MKPIVLLFLFIGGMSLSLFSQEKAKQWAVEVNSGALIGWWVHDKGTDHVVLKNSQGWDRTRTAPTLPVELNFLFRHKKWVTGLGGSYGVFLEDDMIGSRHADNYYDKFRIGNPYVKYAHFYALMEYQLVQKERYAMGPRLKAGSFLIDTEHPDRDNFGFRIFWEAGIDNSIILKWFDVVITPTYRSGYIILKQRSFDNEHHQIVAFGLMAGIRYWIK